MYTLSPLLTWGTRVQDLVLPCVTRRKTLWHVNDSCAILEKRLYFFKKSDETFFYTISKALNRLPVSCGEGTDGSASLKQFWAHDRGLLLLPR